MLMRIDQIQYFLIPENFPATVLRDSRNLSSPHRLHFPQKHLVKQELIFSLEKIGYVIHCSLLKQGRVLTLSWSLDAPLIYYLLV